MISLLVTLNNNIANFKQRGFDSNQYVFFVSEESHHSYDKAAIITGIGLNNIIKISTDHQGRMCPIELEKSIKNQIKVGKNHFILASLPVLRSKAALIISIQSPILHWHITYGHMLMVVGGALLLYSLKKHLLEGCHKADSFSLDSHKMLVAPLVCSAILFKKKGRLYSLNNISGMDCLLRDDDDLEYNLGDFSFQCGRKVDAVKLWFMFKYFGVDGIRDRIDCLIKLADYASLKIKQHDTLTLLSDVAAINICFNYSRANDNTDQANKRIDSIRRELIKQAKYLINTAMIGEKKCFRLIIVNPQL